jgi:hypothetical protein
MSRPIFAPLKLLAALAIVVAVAAPVPAARLYAQEIGVQPGAAGPLTAPAATDEGSSAANEGASATDQSLSAPSAAPDDVPTPVVSDNVEEWSAGQGLLYWAANCFADEFNPFAELKRKPSSGGPQLALESINDGARCATYRSQLSSGDGMYYYSTSQNRIERMPLGAPFTPQPVVTLAPSQAPGGIKGFAEAAGYLYWVSPFSNQVLRTLKDGTGAIETVAETGASPADVIVVGSTAYWTDSTGVWVIGLGCGALPCNATRSQFAPFGANTSGYGLLYISLGGVQGRFRVFWVQRSGSSYQIRYRSCNQITVCTIDPPGTFYASTPNWFIGAPIAAGNHVYWTERDASTPNNASGDVKRKVRTDTSGGADTLATGQAAIAPRLFAAGELLFFARHGAGIYSLPLSASAITRDFSADAMEVTQAIQNLANAVPLVASKTTYVRAYARQLSGPNATNVEARLVGARNGVPLPGSPLAPFNGVRALVTGAGWDRARLQDGWLFQLPSSWITQGAVTLRFQVDPRLIHTDPNRADNERVQSVAFQNQPPICVMTVPVRTHTSLPSTRDPGFAEMVSHFDRRFPARESWIYRDTGPVEELQVCWWGPVPYPCFGPYELDEGWGLDNGIPDRDKVIASLWTWAQLTFNPDACDDIGAPVHHMGMVHPDAVTGTVSGYASLHSNQSWVKLPPHVPAPIPAGWNNVPAGSVMAQELAHNYGRKHILCGDVGDYDSNYPFPPCQIGNVGPDQHYGFDTRTLEPITPNGAADFLTYAGSRWVSSYTWSALLGGFAAAGDPAAGPAPAAGNSVFVTGWVDTLNSRGELGTVLVLPEASVPPATRAAAQAAHTDGAGGAALNTDAAHAAIPQVSYTLRLLAPGGAILVERPLTLIEADQHIPGVDSAFFSDLFPQPAGQVAAIQLLAGGPVLDTLSPGRNPPSAAIVKPAGASVIESAMTIEWTASDPDPADRLLYTVQYSHNLGAAWHTIVADMPGLPAGGGSLALADLGSLPGGGTNRSLVRVLASDGYNTAIALSQPFTVKNRPPDAFILSPAAGQSYPAGDAVLLRGSATDAEDGGLSDAALAWSVDGQPAGSGDAVAAGLAPGAHTAQLAATDSSDNVTTVSAAFSVAPLGVSAVASLLLDGACDDAGYAGAAALPLRPYAGNAQGSVRIARTADHLWACFAGLAKGAAAPGAYAALRVDVDNGRSARAQAGDFAFTVAENGSVQTYAGNGAGGFANPGPGGLQAQVKTGATTWSGELQIQKSVLNGWDHLVGLAAGHYAVAAASDEHVWPYAAAFNAPRTWGTAVLGEQPALEALDPFSAAAGSPALTLKVTGRNFPADAAVRWNGAALPTTFVNAGQLTAQVDPGRLAVAGTAQVSVRSAAGGAESNRLPFEIVALRPAVTSLSPASVAAGSPPLTLTVNGSRFANGSQVLWNGAPVPTTFVNAGQVKAQVAAPLLAAGQTVGVAVRNAAPQDATSDVKPFVVTPVRVRKTFLPSLRR